MFYTDIQHKHLPDEKSYFASEEQLFWTADMSYRIHPVHLMGAGSPSKTNIQIQKPRTNGQFTQIPDTAGSKDKDTKIR